MLAPPCLNDNVHTDSADRKPKSKGRGDGHRNEPMISASCLKAFYCSLCFSESPSVCHQHQHGPRKEGQGRARRMDTVKLEHSTRSRSVNL